MNVNVLYLRWMIRRDVPEVMAIEGTTAGPWTEEDLFCCLRQRNCIGMVEEHKDAVRAFCIYELHRRHFRILNIAVHPSVRRAGIGSAMVTKLTRRCGEPPRRSWLAVNVHESNMDALLFFKAHGFMPTSVLRGMYKDTGEDAVAMALNVKALARKERR